MTARTQKGGGSRNGAAAKLPRLGDATPPAPALVTEVDLKDLGASVAIRKPSVGTMIELQETAAADDADTKQVFGASVALVASMLVEPDWDADRLQKEAAAWTWHDWMTLQNAAGELVDVEGVEPAVRAEFPDQGGP